MSEDLPPDVLALENRPPGYEDGDPYKDVSISNLPEWWRKSINDFESYGFRPYLPPVLDDGELVPEVIDRLESEFDTSIRIMGIDVEYGDSWQVIVDDEAVARIDRRREATGRTVYGTTAAELEAMVRRALE
jgi:hypothetical protein